MMGYDLVNVEDDGDWFGSVDPFGGWAAKAVREWTDEGTVNRETRWFWGPRATSRALRWVVESA